MVRAQYLCVILMLIASCRAAPRSVQLIIHERRCVGFPADSLQAARACAEAFVLVNGYTDSQLVNTSGVMPEFMDYGNRLEIARRRRGELQRKAASVCRDSAAQSYDAVFRQDSAFAARTVDSAAILNGNTVRVSRRLARMVRMTYAFDSLRVIHQMLMLDSIAPGALPGCI
jgi:hypothetical protein